MKPGTISPFLPGLFGFLGMTALGYYFANSKIPSKQEEIGPQGKVSHRPIRSMDLPDQDEIVSEQMHSVGSAATPSERLRAAIALAYSLPPSEFAAWMEGDRFSFRKGPELHIFRMIIFERWIKEDPDSLIPWAGKNNHGQAGRALLALANDNPQRLLDHYRSHPDSKTELGVLAEIAKKQPELALARLQELSLVGLPAEIGRLVEGLLEELAKKSTSALELALAALPPDLRRQAESALSRQRLSTSFQTEIRALWENPEGWQMFESSASRDSALATMLIAELANLPPNWKASMAANPYSLLNNDNGKEWFTADLEGAGFTAAQATKIKRRTLLSLAYSDPEFALENLEQLGSDSGTKTDVISRAFLSFKGDEAKTEKLMAMLPNDEDRQLARDQLKLRDQSPAEIKAQKPSEWLGMLGGIDTGERNSYAVIDQLRNWDKAKLTELRSGFNDLPTDQKQKIAGVLVSGASYNNYDTADTGLIGDALRILVSTTPTASDATRNSNDGGPVMASSAYAVQLAMKNPDEATSWINSLPEGDAKLWARKNVAANWQQYDPPAVAQWVRSLPVDAREQVNQYLKTRK